MGSFIHFFAALLICVVMLRWCFNKLLELVGLQETLPIEEASARKSPSPPPKKAKVEPEHQPPNFSLPLHDATIDEGSQFTFECRVTGFPVPEVCWLKDNISIGSNLDYHTSVGPDGLCSLTIDETFTEDSACFTCRATNHLGYAETTALLSVRENERESPPVFMRLLAPLVSKEGAPVSLVCKVEGTPLPTVQWFKDGTCIDSAPEYTTTYNNGEAVLSVETLRLTDQGQYSCKATNRLGTDTTSSILSVQPMVSEKAPVFVTPLSNVMARAGQKIKLECEVSGVPDPRVEWAHNGKQITETRDIKIQSDGGKAVLTIAEAFPKDAGSYSVMASNAAGQATGSCSVTVKGLLPAETSDSELASDLEPAKPAIPMVLKDTSVCEGGKVRLDCIIVGQPEPEVIWYHDGAPVKESKEIQLQFQGDRCSLVIAEVLPEDVGTYKVVAINSAGEASSSCQLTVQSLGVEPEPTLPVVEPTGIKPLFISLLTDALSTEGDSVTLECAVRGDPTPAVSWSLNNINLQPSDRLKMEQEPGGLCTLVINPVTAEDKGVYTARATNPLGEAKCFAHLIVKSAANLSTPVTATTTNDHVVKPEEKMMIPSFSELFADRSVFDGDSTKFECIVTGKPTPKVRWLYNGEPVSGKDFLASVSGSRQVLTIPVVSKDFVGGQVTCTAENEAGKASCTATLAVIDVPPVDSLLASIDQLNLSQTETTMLEMKREVVMQKTSLSQFSNGGEPTVHVHGMASHSEHTSQKLGDKPPVQTEFHKTSEYHSVDGVQEKLDSQSQSSSVIQGLVPVPVPVKAPVQRRQVSPRFVSPLQGKIVDQGVDVTLECILEGVPPPTVSWRKNSRELGTGTEETDNGRVSLSWEVNKAQCRLLRVTSEDAGKYTCTAANPAGTASCTADLVVKKNVFPPVFGRRLRADTVMAGKRTVLEVEVTGTPDPTVTWLKDGQQIAASSSMYRVLAQGTSHRLVIEQAGHAHSGRYEVRATNCGGEARSAADLLIVEQPDQPTATAATFTGLEMDLPLSTNMSAPKQVVSISESFKSDQKISIQIGHTAVSSDSLFDLPSLNVKPNGGLPNTFSENYQSLSKQEPNTLSQVPLEQSFVIPTEVNMQKDDTVIEDSSISKKSALNFFKNIIKENEVDNKVLQPSEPPQKSFLPEPLPLVKPLHPLSFQTTATDSTLFSQTSVQTCSKQYEAYHSDDGFFLQPEPPPEICFISKSQVTKVKEDMSDRVKKLEESHKSLPQEQIPSGGVRIFPSPAQKPSHTTSTQTSGNVQQLPESVPVPVIPMHTMSTQTSVQPQVISEPPCSIFMTEKSTLPEKYVDGSFLNPPQQGTPDVKSQQVCIAEPPCFTSMSKQSSCLEKSVESSFTKTPLQENSTIKPFEPFKVAKFVIPNKSESIKHEAKSESFSSFQSSSFKSEVMNGENFDIPKLETLGPVLRPSADINLRPQSPRPSAEGIHMEKMWSTRQIDDYVEFPHASPLSGATTKTEPYQETVQKFKSEKSSAFKEVKRTSSPLPSSTGLTMEKIWSPSLDSQRPSSALSTGERPKSPSAEGLAMDKLWAHKSSTQKKVWPPPQPKEDNQPIPSWLNKASDNALQKPADITSEIVLQQEFYNDKNLKFESESFEKVEKSFTQTSDFSERLSKSENTYKEITPSTSVQSYIPPPKPAQPYMPSPKPVQPCTKPVESHDLPPKPVQPYVSPPKPAQPYMPPPIPVQPYVPPSKSVESYVPPPKPAQSYVPPPKPAQPYMPSPNLDHSYDPTSKPVESYVPPPQPSQPYMPSVSQVQSYIPPPKPVHSYIPPPCVPSESKIMYVAETQASHKVNIPPVQPQFLSTETSFSSLSQSTERTENISRDYAVIEENVLRPSEALKKWPPPPREENQEYVKSIVKQDFQSSFQKQESRKEFSTTCSDSVTNGIPLEPGPPPEIGFAEPPLRRQSYVETIEQNLEKNIEREPTKHLAGAVRIIPPPSNKEKVLTSESAFHTKSVITTETNQKQQYVPECLTKSLPDLEPFPFKPDPPKGKPTRCPPPPRPSRFVKGSFTESDYESDCDLVKIPVKWNPCQSDSEDYGYRKVKPPTVACPKKRPHSVSDQVIPPSQFEKPPPSQTVVPKVDQQPEVVKGSQSKIIKTQETYQKTSVVNESKSYQKKSPVLKPGSPPEYVEAPPTKHKPISGKPGSPKTKHKNAHPAAPDSGYMADTEEPALYTAAAKAEEDIVVKTEKLLTYEQSKSELKTLQSSSSKTTQKEFLKSDIQLSPKKQDGPPLEPFPFKPDPVRPNKRPIGPPPPSPSKFIKGEFRESDYESEYESRIRPIWRPVEPTDELSFRPVKPALTPVSGKTQNVGRTPTPPAEFDKPPSFSGPPRPKFEPIDKPKPVSRVNEAVTERMHVIRPTPVQAQAPTPMETIFATPASQSAPEFMLKPGSPPRIDFAPPPHPGYVEKSNIVNFTESSGSTKRVVSVQQTTRVMQFSSSNKNQVKIKENIPPPKTPTFAKESDYESDVDGVVNKSVRTPYIEAEKKRLKRVEEMKKKFLEMEPELQPGEPPEFAFSPGPDPSQVAYSAASKQMNEMTQVFKGKTHDFVSDIMTDIKRSQQKTSINKPILKQNGSEPQTYRDESRISEFASPASPWLSAESQGIVRAVSPGEQIKKTPLFITPLRDIACVSGQPARFECIVLAEPAPRISWSKDGVTLHPSTEHQIEYRNGVCRLVLPHSSQRDAGTYSCSASNMLGHAQTSATLQVPGERRSLYQ